ncbi:MMPL family transporter [Roseospirillum parvum]|uniref:Membrane transport protein MMPL domain-containing protein n=1 Tax=Roseospirillum parvum TaxID=83401 RepID=A0A1G7XR40_9PROT|nr:MMPL family transporter [Roseospirillum parvum]SDG86648.1 hypothetical protein SAMN05421742_10367 [Roseospirillum parvum]
MTVADLIARWVGFASRRAGWVLTLAVLLTLAAGWTVAERFAIDTDTSAMIDPDLPFQQRQREKAEAFPVLDNTLVVVIDAPTPEAAESAATRLGQRLAENPALFGPVFDPQGMAFFRRNGLLYADREDLEGLADSLIRAQPFLARLATRPDLVSLSELLTQALAHGPQSGLDLAPTLDAMAHSLEDAAAGRPGALSWQNLMRGAEPGTPGRRTLVLNPRLDFDTLSPGRRPMDGVLAAAADLGLDDSAGIRVRLTGSVALESEELASVEQGMGWAGVVSLTLVVGLLVWGLKSPRLFVAVLAALLMGLVWTAAYGLLAVGRLNMMSVAFAVLFLGLSVDFGIHFALRYRQARAEAAAHAEGLAVAGREVGPALLLSALAAALGFLSFLPTDYLGFAELGLIAGGGMIIALVANLTLVPAISRLLPPAIAPRAAADPAGRLGQGVQKRLMARPHVVLGGALGLAVAAAAVAPGVRFDFDPLNLKDQNAPSVRTLKDLAADGRDLYRISVLAGDLPAAQALAGRLGDLPEVAEATTLADQVPTDQDAKLAVLDRLAFILLPALSLPPGEAAPPTPEASRAALAELKAALAATGGELAGPAHRLHDALRALGDDAAALQVIRQRLLGTLPAQIDGLKTALEAQAFGLGDLPADLKARFVAPDGRALVSVSPRDDLRDPKALAQFVESVREVAPEATGAPVSIHESGRAVIGALFEAGLITFLGLGLMLLVVLRSLKDTLLVFVPVGLAGLYAVGAMAPLGLAFNFANVIVLPLLFGLGVAGAIHLVSRARRDGAGHLAEGSTPRAVVFSALTTLGSFGAIALSPHAGTASMGQLLSLVIAMLLVATLGVLPALLALLGRR